MPIINGSDINEIPVGDSRNNILYGGASNGRRSGQELDGGQGYDTVRYAGNAAGYSLTANEDGTWTVSDNTTGFIDVLNQIEEVQFADRRWNIWPEHDLVWEGGQLQVSHGNGLAELDVQVMPDGGFILSYVTTEWLDLRGQPATHATSWLHLKNYAPDGQLKEESVVRDWWYMTSDVAVLKDGGYVVTWVSQWDNDYDAVYGQRFTKDGEAITNDFSVNVYADGAYSQPVVTALNDGGYLVLWTSQAQDSSGAGLYARRFDSVNEARYSEFRVNSFTSGDQSDASVLALADGGFVISWTSQGQDGSGSGIYGQRFKSAGLTLGVEFRINDFTAGDQSGSRILPLTGGGYVVLWTSAGQDGSGSGIYGRRYSNSGASVGGGEFRVNTFTPGSQTLGPVASLADGGFVVTWTSVDQDGSGEGVYGQRFDKAGLPLGGEFRINTQTAGNQRAGEITALADGGFIVTWTSGDNGATAPIYGQRYNAFGFPVDGEIRLHEASGFSLLSALPNGGLLEAWSAGAQITLQAAGFADPGRSVLLGSSLGDVMETAGGKRGVTLYGLAGDDLLGGAGRGNVLIGGTGHDTYVVSSAGDEIRESRDEGVDTVKSAISYTLGSHLENLVLTGSANINGTGNELANILTANSGVNVLTGALGDDSYMVDSVRDTIVELKNEGMDTVYSSISITLAKNVENLVLTGDRDRRGTGNSSANTLTGNSGINILAGGLDNDTYFVNNEGDKVLEVVGEGTDRIYSSVNYVLPDNVERLYLQEGFATAVSGTGNGSNNIIYGNSLGNTLRGGGGADLLFGLSGDDRYYVDSVDDDVVEQLDGGTDEVVSSIDFTLLSNIENLTLSGRSLRGTGNGLNNIIKGNTSSNTLKGGFGNDVLYGGEGHDWLEGGNGVDLLFGGKANDTYFLEDAADIISELAGEGEDTVRSTVSWILGDNIEHLVLTGGRDIYGIGNAQSNTLTGNNGNNTLTGGLGNDTYWGYRGMEADTLIENDATTGNKDVLGFLSGVSHDQLWFRRVAQDLEIRIMGGRDKVLIKNWYAGSAFQVEKIVTADGNKSLLSSKVESLVTAMAGMKPPGSEQTSLSAIQHEKLDGVIASSWS